MSDLISRQDVLHAIQGIDPQGDTTINSVLGIIELRVLELPSAEPESKREWYQKGYKAGYKDGEERRKAVMSNVELPSAQPEQQWIPCSERLPDEDCCTGKGTQYSNDVLMSVCNAEDDESIIDYGHTVDGQWFSETTDCFVPPNWNVTAWMPLPEPYKGEQE